MALLTLRGAFFRTAFCFKYVEALKTTTILKIYALVTAVMLLFWYLWWLMRHAELFMMFNVAFFYCITSFWFGFIILDRQRALHLYDRLIFFIFYRLLLHRKQPLEWTFFKWFSFWFNHSCIRPRRGHRTFPNETRVYFLKHLTEVLRVQLEIMTQGTCWSPFS